MIYQMSLRLGMVCLVYLPLSEPLSRAGLSRESASLCKGSVCFFLFCFSSSCVLPQLRTRANMTIYEHQLSCGWLSYRVTVSIADARRVLIVSSIGCLHVTPAGLLLAHDGGLSMM